jgi:hypothetical protein
MYSPQTVPPLQQIDEIENVTTQLLLEANFKRDRSMLEYGLSVEGLERK